MTLHLHEVVGAAPSILVPVWGRADRLPEKGAPSESNQPKSTVLLHARGLPAPATLLHFNFFDAMPLPWDHVDAVGDFVRTLERGGGWVAEHQRLCVRSAEAWFLRS